MFFSGMIECLLNFNRLGWEIMSENRNPVWDIAVVGGGASGLMAAVTAAGTGYTVLLLEQKESLGKKLLATGNGRCNYTNAVMEKSAFHGDLALFEQVYKQFDQADVVSFFQKLGIYPSCQNGYYYPRSGQAASMLHAFEMELLRLNISVKTGASVQDIQKRDGLFEIGCGGEMFFARRVITATGLLAAPALGSNGSLFPSIQKLGHHFTPLVPALCGFIADLKQLPVFRRMAGARTDAVVSVWVEKTCAAKERGELQLTDYGISGIPVFQVSRYASMGLLQKLPVKAVINFMPDWTKEALEEELFRRFQRPSRYRLNFLQILNGLVHDRIAAGLCVALGLVPEQKPKAEAFPELISQFAGMLLAFPVTLDQPKGFEQAQVCAGGICTEEISRETLESKLLPGVYFCGEILDVDGICGGYNLQWAWSSGHVAAVHACESLKKDNRYDSD